jgi:ribose transport system substrate-binding protein
LRGHACPELLNEVIGHAGDVVGNGARQAFGGNLGAMIRGQQCRIGDQSTEQAFDNFSRMKVVLFHAGGVVHVGVEERLGSGPFGFDRGAESGEAIGRLTHLREGHKVAGGYPFSHFADQVGDQYVHHPLEGLAGAESGWGLRELAQHRIVTASKQGHARADLLQRENPGIHAVVEIGRQIGDLVGEIDQLCLERGPQAEEIFRQLRMLPRVVVARVLDDAFADAEREIEAAERSVAFLKPGHDAQRVEIVIEAQPPGAQCLVQRLFAGMTEWRVAYVVDQRKRLGQIGIQAEGGGHGSRNLSYFQRMREAAAEVVSGLIAWDPGEDLRLAREAAESPRVQNASAVPGEWCTVSMRPFDVHAMREVALQIAAHSDAWRQRSTRLKLLVHHACRNLRRWSGYIAVGGVDVLCEGNAHVGKRKRVDHHHRGARCYKMLHAAADWTRPGIREYHPARIGRFVFRTYFRIASNLFTYRPEARMRAIKKAGIALLALGVGLISGCERHSNKEVFYMVITNTALPYWQTAASGFNHAAAGYKVTAKVVGPENYDAQAELAELNKAVAAKPAGILISVADAGVLQPGIDAAITAGIPVLTIDSDAAGSRRLFFIGTNNLQAGQLGGKRLIEKMNGKGNLMIFTIPGQPNTEERLKGLKDALSSKPGINVVETVDIGGDARKAFDKTQETLALTGPKKVDAFICLESASGKMVSDAIKRANATDRVLVAFDVNQDTLDGIKGGTIDSTIAQKPYTMGYVGLKALDEIFHNPPAQLAKDYSVDSFSPYPVFVDTGTSLVDKNNVDLYLASAAEGSK